MTVVYSRIPALFGAQAMAIAPGLILLHPEREGDTALIAHEEKHAEQQRAHGNAAGWWLQYLTSRAFRQQAEVEAYRVQIAHGASVEGCARALATMYRLGLDFPTAWRLLTE